MTPFSIETRKPRPAPGLDRVPDSASSPAAATDDAGPPAIEAAAFGWTYAGRAQPALRGLTFRLEPGRVLLVLGPSGSGKSTLARALTGLVPHTLPGRWQGGLRIGELDVATTPARFLGERVGLVFQDPDSQLVMSGVEDEVAFGLENRGWPRPRMAARVPEALAEVGLAGFEPRGTSTLSGGEKQRLAMADVLAPRPSLLVFDEPTANLDPPGMQATLERLASLARRREHTIVLIEHRLEAALPLADDVLLLDEEGRQLAFAPSRSVGRGAVSLLERSGAWVPRSWLGAKVARAAAVAFSPGVPASGDPGESGSDQVLLTARDLILDYPSDKSGTHRALDGVSLEARPGERIAIVGPNGAGKSTLLFLLAGLRRATSGAIALRARPRQGEAVEELRDPTRLRPAEIPARVGLVFQDPELGFVAQTAREEVAATSRAVGAGGGEVTGIREGAGKPPDTDAILDRFGLGHLAEENPFRLSGGEQRRLSLAALVPLPPALLLLDEPTFGLDRRGTAAVMCLLDDLRATGQAQLLATHDPRLLPLCDRVVALDRGRIVFEGPPEKFLADPPYSPAEPWRDGATERRREPAEARAAR